MFTAPQSGDGSSSSAAVVRGRQAESPLRRPIALLLSRFPLVTETFILREILELERLGQPVRLVPLIRESPGVMHREARPWVERALYTPFLSGPILLSNLRVLSQRPATYWKLLRKLVLGSNQKPGVRLRTLALFPKFIHLAERLPTEGIRHIHAHFATYPATAAYIISSLTDITYSLTVHAHDIFVGQEMLEEKLAAAEWIRTISDFNRRYLLDLYPNLPTEKFRVIHVGVDPHQEPIEDLPPAATPRSPLILSIAALKPYKGLAILLGACTQLRDRGVEFRCEIIGDGPLRGRLQLTIDRSDLGDVVQLMGSRTQNEVARSLSEAAVVVLPSIVASDGQMEGIPVALMEAMAAGRPVVASSLSGIPELIENGVEGYLTTPGDERELAAAMESLLADRATAAAMGARGQRRVAEHFHLGTTVRDLLGNLDDSNPQPAIEIDPRACGSSHFHPRSAPVGVRKIHQQRDSTVVELLLEAHHQPNEVIFKTHRSFVGQSRSALVRAREEFHWLDKIHRLLGDDSTNGPDGGVRLGVPRPLELFEDSASLTMERCQGRSLLRQLQRYRQLRRHRATDEIPHLVSQVGAWLRAFQAFPLDTTERLTGERYLQHIADDALHGLAIHLPASRVSNLRQRLDCLQAQIDPHSIQWVARHGDFSPGNIFVSSAQVQVIDFEGLGTGLVYEDLANFIAHLELLFAYPLARRRGRELIRLLLEGYLADTQLDTALYQFCRSVALLKLTRSQPQRAGSHPIGAWRRHHLFTRVASP